MLSDRLTALIRNPETPTWALRDAVQEEEPAVASVWVVVGATDDRYVRADDKWTVAAFLDEASAKSLCNRLNEWCRTNGFDKPNGNLSHSTEPRPTDDPMFRCYLGTLYRIEEIPLRVEEGT